MSRPRTASGIALAAVAVAAAMLIAAQGAFAATIHVTKTGDPTPNGCKRHDCSLREGVIKANSTPAPDTIKLEAKTYKLTIPGSGEDTGASGDLDVTKATKIVGSGASKTVIRGDWASDADRLVEVLGGRLKASGLTLRDGFADNLIDGAALRIAPGVDLKLTNVRVTSNDSQYGAVANQGTAVLRRVMINKNHASGCCPGFYNEGGSTARMTDVTFDRNTAVNDTGAMYSDGDKATLKNVTFSRNRAGIIGGGALIPATGITNLTNVTFSANSTKGSGGAIYTTGSSTTNLNNVTFTKNIADSDDVGGGDGGGLYNGSADAVNMQNTILAGNVDKGGEAPDCGQSSGVPFTTGGHNLVGSGDGCNLLLIKGSDLVGAPGLLPLADNGGFTKTVALKKHSNAINHGSGKNPGSGGEACAKRDQRGVKRPQGTRCDIGAYERTHKHHHHHH